VPVICVLDCSEAQGSVSENKAAVRTVYTVQQDMLPSMLSFQEGSLNWTHMQWWQHFKTVLAEVLSRLKFFAKSSRAYACACMAGTQ